METPNPFRKKRVYSKKIGFPEGRAIQLYTQFKPENLFHPITYIHVHIRTFYLIDTTNISITFPFIKTNL